MPGYFIDTSALAKLYHTETGSDRMEVLVQSSGVRLVISQLSLIEIESVKRRGAASGLVASDRNLCAVAAVEGLTVLNPTQGG